VSSRVNTLTKWWVEPNYVALPIPTFPLRCILSVREFVIKVIMSKGVLVNRRRFLKCLFVRREKCNAFVDSVGNCLVMLGGWFECLLMYNGSSLGFLYGLCFALFRSKVTSKKFTTFKFTSAVIFRLNCSKILCNSFEFCLVNGRICFL
jgi:hypothetical protein